jgi:hypothetical protein
MTEELTRQSSGDLFPPRPPLHLINGIGGICSSQGTGSARVSGDVENRPKPPPKWSRKSREGAAAMAAR